MLSVYALGEDTPTKQLGEDLAKLIEDENSPQAKDNKIETSPDNPNNLLYTPVPATNLDFVSLGDPVLQRTIRFWAKKGDEIQTRDESSDEIIEDLKQAFKRKADGIPENQDFEKILSRKERKKLKQLLNKSS